ncbi:DUF2264 domain-containing protein [Gorillibacterium sp. CAU 1737]|uniref:DUF2264 domain-containing protein n=1 Tax=Gorillibacterium sp. CAU 1737 TaxID=3140362 RepID=UPI003261588B
MKEHREWSIAADQLRKSPMRTKRDVQEALRHLLMPLEEHLSEGGGRLALRYSGAGHPHPVADMEGFSRLLWGMAPYVAGDSEEGESEAWWSRCLRGILAGTDPDSEDYWGEVNDYDQRLVEMAAIGLGLCLIPEKLWEPLEEKEKANLYAWLSQVNDHSCCDCNWLFFPIMVNLGFRRVGLPVNQELMEANLDRMESFYLGRGWYSDGEGGHSDYYIPFAIHYYGLLYATFMGEEDPQRATLFKERAAAFAADFLQWFSPDGSAVPYGRSLTYRFAQAAFWSALAYAEVEVPGLTTGMLKGLVLRHLRWWWKQPILDAAGVLTVGYGYPNLVMAENYNAPGSPYWAFKTFLVLALPDDHPFWKVDEEPLPTLPKLSIQPEPHLVLCRDEETGHVAAFNSGHRSSNEHTHTSAKYEKFAYSTAFGFSVPRAEWGLWQGAFDSMLALSEEDNLFRVRRRNEETRIKGDVLYARWQPWRDVEVETWVIAGLPWHARVHLIKTRRGLDAAEGGFALGLGSTGPGSGVENCGVWARTEHGAVGAYGLVGFSQAEVLYPQANTNVLHPRTVIPTLRTALPPGTHLLAGLFYGRPGSTPDAHPDALTADAAREAAMRLGVSVHEGEVKIVKPHGTTIIRL